MKRLFLGIAALTAFTLLIAGGARADSTPAVAPAAGQGLSGEELAAQVRKLDDSTLQKSAHAQADNIRQIPNELRVQGIQISPEQEQQIMQAADTLQAQASQPDFKDKVAGALKSMGHGLKIVAIDAAKDAGKGIGYAGTAVLAASFTPVTFTGDLVMGIAVGHGVFSESKVSPSPSPSASASPSLSGDSSGGDNTVAAHFEYEGALGAGIGGFYLAYVGLDALGYTVAAPVIASSMGIVVVNWLVCARFDNSDNSELDRYCSNNAKLAGAILHGSARGGAIIGDGIHKGVLKGAHAIWDVLKWPFSHKKRPAPQPSPSPSSS